MPFSDYTAGLNNNVPNSRSAKFENESSKSGENENGTFFRSEKRKENFSQQIVYDSMVLPEPENKTKFLRFSLIFLKDKIQWNEATSKWLVWHMHRKDIFILQKKNYQKRKNQRAGLAIFVGYDSKFCHNFVRVTHSH